MGAALKDEKDVVLTHDTRTSDICQEYSFQYDINPAQKLNDHFFFFFTTLIKRKSAVLPDRLISNYENLGKAKKVKRGGGGVDF